MMVILGSQHWLYMQLMIVLITLGLALYDLYTERIPNKLNLILFGLMLMVGIQLNHQSLYEWLTNMLWVTGIGFGLFASGALGGGDCKYLIAISPVIELKALIVALLFGMGLFVAVFAIKQVIYWIRRRTLCPVSMLVTGKMPFLWAMVPGLLAVGVIGI